MEKRFITEEALESRLVGTNGKTLRAFARNNRHPKQTAKNPLRYWKSLLLASYRFPETVIKYRINVFRASRFNKNRATFIFIMELLKVGINYFLIVKGSSKIHFGGQFQFPHF